MYVCLYVCMYCLNLVVNSPKHNLLLLGGGLLGVLMCSPILSHYMPLDDIQIVVGVTVFPAEIPCSGFFCGLNRLFGGFSSHGGSPVVTMGVNPRSWSSITLG